MGPKYISSYLCSRREERVNVNGTILATESRSHQAVHGTSGGITLHLTHATWISTGARIRVAKHEVQQYSVKLGPYVHDGKRTVVSESINVWAHNEIYTKRNKYNKSWIHSWRIKWPISKSYEKLIKEINKESKSGINKKGKQIKQRSYNLNIMH
jgi:hypothetical protein